MLQGNTSHGAMMIGPGHVKHAGTGYITISSLSEVILDIIENNNQYLME